MNKTEVRAAVRIMKSDVNRHIDIALEKALSTQPCKDIFAQAEDMIPVKALMCAILENQAWQYEPLSKEGKALVKRIKPCM